MADEINLQSVTVASLAVVADIVERACIITGDAPYFMCAEPEFAKVEIDEGRATLFWPEWAGGYYAGDGNIERQSVTFPVKLLLLTRDELAAWKIEEKRRYEAREEEKRAASLVDRAARQTELELATLGQLMVKYNVKVA